MDQVTHIDEPIEILVDLAKKGEIDPWDIDLVKVADKFLERLERFKELDLRLPVRTLLYASILLRMKSEALFIEEEEDLEEDLYEDLCEDIAEVEEEVKERASSESDSIKIYPKLRRMRKRPITLDDLIKELKKAEKVEINRKRREEKKIRRDDSLRKTVLDSPHEEEIEDKISKLRERLKKRSQENIIQFSELTAGLGVKEVIDTYIPLLFLASKKEIWLKQDDLFGELYIRLREGFDGGREEN
ncbi:MAG: segregation/condensation protein A [Candidatus Syntropharchaeales archaeon]